MNFTALRLDISGADAENGCSLTGYLYLGCIAGAAYVYVRMRGWKLSDLAYVTRASLKESLSSMESGAGLLSDPDNSGVSGSSHAS